MVRRFTCTVFARGRERERKREMREYIARELLTQREAVWGKPEVFGQGKTLPPSRANAHLYRSMIFRDRAGAFLANRCAVGNWGACKSKSIGAAEERNLKEQRKAS